MNYNQRKHIERLMANAPPQQNLLGLRIIESPDVPRYTLPEEVIPGVPWPPGFRDEINAWSRSFLGTTNRVPRGAVYVLANGYAIMRPEDIVKISGL